MSGVFFFVEAANNKLSCVQFNFLFYWTLFWWYFLASLAQLSVTELHEYLSNTFTEIANFWISFMFGRHKASEFRAPSLWLPAQTMLCSGTHFRYILETSLKMSEKRRLRSELLHVVRMPDSLCAAIHYTLCAATTVTTCTKWVRHAQYVQKFETCVGTTVRNSATFTVTSSFIQHSCWLN